MPGVASARRGAATLAILGLLSLAAAGCGSSSSGGSSGAPSASASPSATAAVLGAPNKATGTPVKIGFVEDGKSEAIDTTSTLTAAQDAVKYANDYLGGLNGHVIEIDSCETLNTPTNATGCGVQMVKDKVAALLSPYSSQDHSVFAALDGKLPYITGSAADFGILSGKTGFVLTNPLGPLAAGIQATKKAGVKKAGIIIIDVPAAVGPVKALSTPYYAKAGIALDVIPISASVADQTPQIEQAISRGDGAFSITGTPEFTAVSLKALKQLNFHGPVVSGIDPFPPELGGQANVLNTSYVTSDATDKDVQLYQAIKQKYGAVDAKGSAGYVVVMSFVKALTGNAKAIDAASVQTAFSTMPAPLPLPLGQGMTFQCGSHPFALVPSVCGTGVLLGSPGTDGIVKHYDVLDVNAILGS